MEAKRAFQHLGGEKHFRGFATSCIARKQRDIFLSTLRENPWTQRSVGTIMFLCASQKNISLNVDGTPHTI